MKLIAHRGYSSEAPENTKASFKLAIEKGFKHLECDVRFTSDDVAVLLHDETIKRTSNSYGKVSALSLKELKQLDFGSWFHPVFINEPIMLFSDFIELCFKHSIHPYIELKQKKMTRDQINSLIDIVEVYYDVRDVTWLSFDISNLLQLSVSRKELRIGVLGKMNFQTLFYYRLLKHSNHQLFLNVSRKIRLPYLYRHVVKQSITVEMWTIDSPYEARKRLSDGVKGITTNFITKDLLYQKD